MQCDQYSVASEDSAESLGTDSATIDTQDSIASEDFLLDSLGSSSSALPDDGGDGGARQERVIVAF